jgi:hypothetical protein
MTDSTQALMIHVERIVRPLRATSARKLRMRRELLAHLQSALDEERQRGADETAAAAAAFQRLGDPAELQRSLQCSVPRLERILLSRPPTSPRMDSWGERSTRNLGMEGMGLGPSVIAGVGGTVLAYGTTALNMVYFILHYRGALEVAFGRGTTGVKWGMQACTLLTALAMLIALQFLGRRARHARLGWKDAALVAGEIATSIAWMTAAILAIGASLTWQPLALSIVTAAVMLLALALLARWMRTVPRPHTEWLRLRIDV